MGEVTRGFSLRSPWHSWYPFLTVWVLWMENSNLNLILTWFDKCIRHYWWDKYYFWIREMFIYLLDSLKFENEQRWYIDMLNINYKGRCLCPAQKRGCVWRQMKANEGIIQEFMSLWHLTHFKHLSSIFSTNLMFTYEYIKINTTEKSSCDEILSSFFFLAFMHFDF